MTLTLTRSGGLLGVPLPPVVLDTATLSAADRQRVGELVEQTQFFKLPASLIASGAERDRFQYDLEILGDHGQRHQVSFGESATPAGLAELVRIVQSSRRK